jgi:hypothetical protein
MTAICPSWKEVYTRHGRKQPNPNPTRGSPEVADRLFVTTMFDFGFDFDRGAAV